MRGILAVVGLLAGCDALWRIDAIDPPVKMDGGHGPDAPAVVVDGRAHTGPFMHFTMDTHGATSTTDSVSGYDAVCGAGCPDLVMGHVGGALQFGMQGQADQRLQVAAISAFHVVDQFSVAGWIQLTTLASEACPWSKPYSTGISDTWQLCINPSGAVSFITYGTGGNNQVSTAPGWATLDGNFHHVATVYDGTTKSLYWDGEVAAQGAAATPLVDDNDVVLANDLDGTMYVAQLDGALDELAFYTYALTPTEVAGLAAH